MERVNREPDVVDKDRTEVRIIKFAESGIDCQLFVRIKDPRRIPLRYSDMLRLIYRTLGEAGIAIPFPQRVMHLTTMDEEQIRTFSKYPGSGGRPG
jgi:small-conductance mechanosensitive channel